MELKRVKEFRAILLHLPINKFLVLNKLHTFTSLSHRYLNPPTFTIAKYNNYRSTLLTIKVGKHIEVILSFVTLLFRRFIRIAGYWVIIVSATRFVKIMPLGEF